MLSVRTSPSPTKLAEAAGVNATAIVQNGPEKRQINSRPSPARPRDFVTVVQTAESAKLIRGSLDTSARPISGRRHPTEEDRKQSKSASGGVWSAPASAEPVMSAHPQSRHAAMGPTSCTVCAATETPEWRKGPAGMRTLCNGCGLLAAKRQKERSSFNGRAFPHTVEEIIYELEQIGRERFKSSAKGRYHLPPGTIQRVIDLADASAAAAPSAERRTPSANPASTARRPRSRSNRSNSSEAQAAGALYNMARRASTGTAITPHSGHATALAPRTAPSMSRGRRSGSFGAERTVHQPKLVSSSAGLPPSSGYMLPFGGVGPASTFSFGTASMAAHIPTECVSPRRHLSTVALPPLPAPLPSPSFPPHRNIFRPPSPPLRPMSALAASTDRMSIQHLVAPDPATPTMPSPPRFEMPPPVRLGPVSALRGRSTSIGPGSPEGSHRSLGTEALASRRPTV